MKQWKIAFSSVTYAEKGKGVLAARGIRSRIVRLEPWESSGGCAYGLEVPQEDADAGTLETILTRGHVRYSEILRG